MGPIFFNIHFFACFYALFCLTQSIFPNPISPHQFLQSIYLENQELASIEARYQAEKKLTVTSYSLNNPRIGIMQDKVGNEKMNSLTLSQDILFPTKYFILGSKQAVKTDALEQMVINKKLDVRKKALRQFYNLYVAHKILNLIQAQKESLREIARIVETRRAMGAIPQQDEMKAHLEQTKIENQIILQKQDVDEMELMLASNFFKSDFKINFTNEDYKTPRLETLWENKINEIEKFPELLFSKKELETVDSELTLAKMNYLPDFMITYKKPFSNDKSSNNFSFGLEFTIPLWFFMKEFPTHQSMYFAKISKEKELEFLKKELNAKVKSLSLKTQALQKILKIDESSMIPQAKSVLNASQAAYVSGKVGFQELLEAERSLYETRIEYWSNLGRYFATIIELETLLGASISDLPF